MFLPRLRGVLAVAVLAVAPVSALAAQSSALVDEGTLMVTRNGTPLGREAFRIARVPGAGGQVFRASGTSAVGDARVTSALATDSAGLPVSYELEVNQGGEVVQRIQGRGRPGRFSVLTLRKTGESGREYVLDNGALVIDDNVFHQFYFVPLAASHARVAVIAPQSGDQTWYTIQRRGADTLTLAGRKIPARRYSLAPQAGGAAREVWVDTSGRLLKVAIPGEGLVALRDELP